jgi:uncharacterized protein YecE (DUF72 family)
MGRIHLGTSGYVYAHWKRVFYPPGVPGRLWLQHYASVFSSVELNSTFYRLPRESAVESWRDSTPPSFLFAVKGSRFLTHMKRLTEVDFGVLRFFELVERLGVKLGPVLWQLPPQMNKPDLERLENFILHLPTNVRHVFEFRSDAWYTDEVCDVLDRYGVAFCEHDLVRREPPAHTGGFRYRRFHGATAPYSGRYGKRALLPHVEDLTVWTAGGRHAFVYFNNDLHGHAISDALDFSELLGSPIPAGDGSLLARAH